MTLTEFLHARIAEDESQMAEMDGLWDTSNEVDFASHVLVECDTKRQIVRAAETPTDLGNADANDGWDIAWALTLCFLALPYSDHPDYDERWRP